MFTQDELRKELRYLLENLKEDYLSDNCKTVKDTIAYGDTYKEYTDGYSDADWKRASTFAEGELIEALNFIINNN